MTKTVSIVQSNYIPWKGYFDLIGLADEFIILDNVQYTKNDWRNRNRIKVNSGSPWLTIPVKTGGRFGQNIDQVEIDDPTWAGRHWARLKATYRGQPGFALHGPAIAAIYEAAAAEPMLSAVNRLFIDGICAILSIKTVISLASDRYTVEGKNDRVIALCKSAGASRYLSGPAAKSYLDDAAFAAQGMEVAYIDYDGYPTYAQAPSPFEHGVSVLDLLFRTGDLAPRYMKTAGYRQNHPWPAG
jgi:hypothetical protein